MTSKCSFKKKGDPCKCKKELPISFGDLYLNPPNALLTKSKNPSDYIARGIAVWAPELLFPDECPHLICHICQYRLNSSGWNKHGPQPVRSVKRIQYSILAKVAAD